MHPESQAELRSDPAVIGSVVEEMLRWEPPVWSTGRPTREVEVSGVRIPAGEMVLVSSLAANHDETEFENPDEVDLRRATNRHLTFAVGAHRCIGSHLARIELQVALEELHRRLPPYRLDPDQPPVHLGVVTGYHALPIRFD